MQYLWYNVAGIGEIWFSRSILNLSMLHHYMLKYPLKYAAAGPKSSMQLLNQSQDFLNGIECCHLLCCIFGVSLAKVDQFIEALFCRQCLSFAGTKIKAKVHVTHIEYISSPAMVDVLCEFGESRKNCSRIIEQTRLIIKGTNFKLKPKAQVIHIR